MEPAFITAIASLLVAIVVGLSSYASQRAQAKATRINANTTSRTDLEKEAYERARSYDTETIRRQDEEIDEVRSANKELQSKVTTLTTENEDLKRQIRALVVRITRLERAPNSNTEGENLDE